MGPHPYERIWQTRDLEVLANAVSEDVELLSPLLTKPFSGRQSAVDLFEALFAAFPTFEITRRLSSDDRDVFFWRAETGGTSIQGTDLITLDPQGLISEIEVYIRPLRSMGAFAAIVGPRLARKRGSVRALLVRILTVPLRAIFVAVDIVSSRLTQK